MTFKFTEKEFIQKIEEGISKNIPKDNIVSNSFCDHVACDNCELWNKGNPYCVEALEENYTRLL